MKTMNWKLTIGALMAGAAGISVWLFMLVSEAVATQTREDVILIHPTTRIVLFSTALMLTGVVLISIQVARIVEYLMKKETPPAPKRLIDKGFGQQ